MAEVESNVGTDSEAEGEVQSEGDVGEETESGEEDALSAGEETEDGEEDALSAGETEGGEEDALSAGEETEDGEEDTLSAGEETEDGEEDALSAGEEAEDGEGEVQSEGDVGDETEGGEESDGEDEYSCLHEKFITKTQKKSKLRNEVGQWNRGRWSAKELATLKHNLHTFLQKHKKIKDPAEIIFSERHDRIRSKFYQHIARNIRRPLFSVYRKATRNFNIQNYVRNWSSEQVDHLLREHAKLGNQWAKIGRSMGVSGRAVRDKHRLISNRERIGPWLPEEEECLVATMKELHGSSSVDELVVSPAVTWDQVAEHVHTRNGAQCRSKWLHYRPVEWEGRRWGDRDDLQLLELLSGETAQDEDEVNWVQLAHGWASARSPYLLRRKWATLRRRVPGSALKSFQERLDYLTDHLVPVLTRNIG